MYRVKTNVQEGESIDNDDAGVQGMTMFFFLNFQDEVDKRPFSEKNMPN